LPNEMKEHLEAMHRWIDKQSNIPIPDIQLSLEKKKQLQTVNKAIRQLTRLNVPVPEDLRKLKLQLSVKDVLDPAEHEIKDRLVEIEFLIEQLSEIIKKARSLEKRLKRIGKASGAKKYYGVTLLDLLRNGDLSPEDRLELQWLKNGPVYEGKVQKDGTLMAQTPKGWKQYGSLSTAATQIVGRPLNGWTHWRRINSDGSYTAMKEIRLQHISGRENK